MTPALPSGGCIMSTLPVTTVGELKAILATLPDDEHVYVGCCDGPGFHAVVCVGHIEAGSIYTTGKHAGQPAVPGVTLQNEKSARIIQLSELFGKGFGIEGPDGDDDADQPDADQPDDTDDDTESDTDDDDIDTTDFDAFLGALGIDTE
jgi:hypothetical protein